LRPKAGIRWGLLLAPQPALLTGVLVMRAHGVPAIVWKQNLVAGIVLTLASAVVLLAPRRRLPSALWLAISGVGLVMLTATLFGDGLDGVKRWIALGPVTLHPAAIALPLMLIALGLLREAGAFGRLVPFIGLCALIVLALQPDAAQASAFGAALVALLAERRRRAATWLIVFAIAIVVAWSWVRPDPLLPVAHVEGMFAMARASGVLWLIASMLALVLLPVPFLVAARIEKGSMRSVLLSLGVYFGIVCVAPLAGAFPVPLLGFGLSSIVGYFLALAWTNVRLREGSR